MSKLKLLAATATFALALICFLLNFPSGKKENWQKEKKEFFESRTEALDALQTLNRMAAYPNRDIAPDAYTSAINFYHANAVSRIAPSTSATGGWTSIGPRNLGGRTLCIALDPTDTSKIWLGSAGGGLWKSNVGGVGVNAWTYVPTGFPVNSVSSIAINPNNHLEIYIGTGETYSYGTAEYGYGLIDRPTRGTFGMGILKTTDGGLTWTQSLNWTYQQNRGVWEIIYNPLRTNTLYAATTEGIYKTTDAGTTWTQVLNEQMAMDLQIHKVDTNIILCGVGNMSSPNKGLYRTTNSGATWSIVTTGLPSNANRNGRIVLAAYPGNNDLMMAEVDSAYGTVGVYYSSNKGATWVAKNTFQDIVRYQGWYAKGLLFKNNDATNIIAAGVEVYGSYDTGANFLQLSDYNSNPPTYMHSDVHDVISNPLDPDKIYIATDGGLFRSNDFGQTFSECTDGYVTSQFYIGSVSYQDSTIGLGGAQDNYVNRYFGSQYWTPVVGGDGTYTAIDYNDDQIQYGAYQYCNIIQSNDQGNSFWNQIYYTTASPTAYNPEAFLAPYLVSPNNTQDLYAGLDHLIKSTNQGGSFFNVGPNPLNGGSVILSIGVSATNDDTVYVACAPDGTNNMKIFRSVDGGTTMTNISTGLPNRYPRRITVNPHNPSELYVMFSGFGTGHIFRSTNAGASWTNISTGLPDLPFHCLAIDPSHTNIIYAGCDLGAWVSTNNGATWSTFDTGFADATMVYDLVISPVDNTLVCFTHGHGVYKRKLSDISGINDPVSFAANVSVYPNPAAENVYVNIIGKTDRNTSVEVFDLNGKKVKTVNSEENTIQLNVNGFSSGVYLIKVDNGGRTACKKLIVQ